MKRETVRRTLRAAVLLALFLLCLLLYALRPALPDPFVQAITVRAAARSG